MRDRMHRTRHLQERRVQVVEPIGAASQGQRFQAGEVPRSP
jgi:hypothetical protein